MRMNMYALHVDKVLSRAQEWYRKGRQ